MDAEDHFYLERGAVFASAIGIARLYLQQDKPHKALVVLNEACDKVHNMHLDACIADGINPSVVEMVFGPRR